MDARPILFMLARALHEHRLEAVLIGNAAAALQGAPVTTLDFDFLFRKTPVNLRKLKAVAKSLGAVLLKPPEPLWAEAVALARTQGLFPTARTLRLDYASLKKRVQRSAASRPGAPPDLTALGRLLWGR